MSFDVMAKSQEKYAFALENFVSRNKLPSEFFEAPDHLAIKCADADDYRSTCNNLFGYVDGDGIWELELDGRMLASARFAGAVLLGGYGFERIEIMGPKPGKEAPTGFIEHTEFFFPYFPVIEAVLRARGVKYSRQMNEGHRWINVPIDSVGREVKFNDRLLEDVVSEEIERGELRPYTN